MFGNKRPSGYLKVEFLNRHPEMRDIIDTTVVEEYLDSCPIEIVEYKGTLKDETKNQRKNRMQCHKVYKGDIKDLMVTLRNTYQNKRSMSSHALLLEVYESIKSIDTIDVTKAKQELVDGNSNVENIEKSVVEEPQNIGAESVKSDVKIVETSEPVQSGVTDIIEEEVEKEKENKTLLEKEKLNNGITDVKVEDEEKVEQEVPTPTTEPAVTTEVSMTQPETSTKIQNINKPNKEEKKMADNNLKDAISKATSMMKGQVSEGEGGPTTPNLPKATLSSASIDSLIANELSASAPRRNAWTQNNAVSAIIMTQTPAALRLVGDPMGSVIKAGTKEEDIATTMEGKYLAFIKAVSGKAMAIAEFANADDAIKFANCVDETAVKKARAMFTIFNKCFNNPTEKIKAFVDPSKASAPVRGYTIGENNYTADELMTVLLDEANGIVYGIGTKELDPENQVYFKLNFASRRQANATSGSSKNASQKQMVIQAKNKAAFLGDDAHKKYLMTTYDTEANTFANFKAEIVIDGQACNATCSVWDLDDQGRKIENGTDSEGNTKYKKKICSINVSVPVKKVVKEIAKEFHGELAQPVDIGNRWNVKLPTAEQKDYAAVVDQRNSFAFKALQQILSGEAKAGKAILDKSTVYADLEKAAKEQQGKEDAATQGDIAM